MLKKFESFGHGWHGQPYSDARVAASVFLAIALLLIVGHSALAEAPISLHPDNPHYLLFRGKPTILITSTEHYGAVLNGDFDYIPYLTELQNKKLNLTRTFSGVYRELPGTFNITDNTLAPKTKDKFICPWARSDQPGASDGGNKFDLSKFDPAYFARLKDFVTQAGNRGVVVELVLFCTTYDDKLWAASPQNSANNIQAIGKFNRTELYTLKHPEMVELHDALVRKIASELKDFDNLYYEICNEPYFAGVADDWQAHISATLAEAEKDFSAKHLIAQNIANGGKKIDKPDTNVSIFNFHYATPPDTVEQNYKLNKVQSDDETGFRGKDDVHYRTEAWEFIMAGGAIYDNLDYSFTPPHPDGSFADYKSPGGGGNDLRNQLRILHDFMADLDFIHMKPMNEIIKGGSATAPLAGAPARSAVTVRAFGKAGSYAIYIRGGTQTQLALDIPALKYHYEWINTKTGKVESSGEFEGEVKLGSPAYSEDIAVRIKSTAAAAVDVPIDIAQIDRERIQSAAEVAMKLEPISITRFHAKFSEGGPNDFYSNGDYWWPDPAKPDGLPYIQRDGESNPDNFDAHRMAVRNLRDAVAALGAAYKITGEDRYAAKSAELLKVFFLDPATRMNPHLQYAQAIPGRSPGRGIGIIDALHLIEIPLAVDAMAKSPAFPSDVHAGVKKWFGDFANWMVASKNGQEEAKAKNNHSVAYFLQLAVYAKFSGDEAKLAECRRQYKEVFLSEQMAADGSFPQELRRTKPYGYSIFQLDNLLTMCQVLSRPQDDLWKFRLVDGRGAKKAMEYLYPFLADKSKWPKKPDIASWESWPARQPCLLFAGIAYGDQKYIDLWRKLPPDPADAEVRRNIAITQPILWVK